MDKATMCAFLAWLCVSKGFAGSLLPDRGGLVDGVLNTPTRGIQCFRRA